MSSQLSNESESEFVIPFTPRSAVPDDADQLDKAGHTILRLLQKAAGVAEANGQYALDMAQKLDASKNLAKS